MPTNATITTTGIERSTAEGYDWTFRRVMKWDNYMGERCELVLRRHTYKNVHVPSMKRFFALAKKTYGMPSMDIISTKPISLNQWTRMLVEHEANDISHRIR